MPEILLPPETTADAIVIVRSLSDAELVPTIKQEFGEPLYGETYDNALAWQAKRDQEQHPHNEELISLALFADTYVPGTITGSGQIDQATAPGELQDILAEQPLFPDVVPHPFDADESEVVLLALRLTAENARPEEQLIATDFLARNAPRRRERIVHMLAVAGVTGLLANSLRLLK